MVRARIVSLFMLALAACGEPIEEPLPSANELARVLPRPRSHHGVIELGASIESELSRREPLHAWQFTLTGRAQIELRTQQSVAAAPDSREVDTVLVLERVEPSGARRWLAQNDDVDRSRFSRIARTLPAGTYELRVHGFRPNTRGRFALATTCTGEGCPVAPPTCWFGSVFSDLRTHAELTIVSETFIHMPEQLGSDIERAQVLIAVQQSTHTDVTTTDEAIARVDQGEVRRLELQHQGGATYLAFEYGAGDNSYGALFAAGSTTVLASIQDGDLLACTSLESP